MELLEIALETIKVEIENNEKDYKRIVEFIEENKNNAKFSDLYIKLLNELLEGKKRSIDNLKLIKDKYKKILERHKNEK
nr:MAG TPA: hypothetical protein [Caudoviricetes sp.]